MSGIFLVIWDSIKKFNELLKPTVGGPSHITLAYTGDHLSSDELKSVAKETVDYWLLKPITLTKATVNSFYHRGEKKTRHDVLLMVDEVNEIKASRDSLLRTRFPDRQMNFMFMPPYVTVGTYWNKEVAESEAVVINESFLPRTVSVIGVAID